MSDAPKPNTHQGDHDLITTPEQKPISPRTAIIGVVLVTIVALLLAGLGILSRHHANTVLAERTQELAPPTVNVAPARSGQPVEAFVLPGNVTSYTDSPIYARTDGYLVRWYYDIGAKVKKGALLAVIDTPELDKQVAQGEADLATAVTNASNAKVQADRYAGLVKSNAVSQQDTDTFTTQAAATASAVRSAQANLQRLRELQSFEKVYAPFDGVVTARTVDTGQLISSGSNAELFHMQALQTLRIYTNVPQIYSQTLKPGMKIDLTFPEHPGKTYEGTLVRTAQAIDPVTRTLLVEVDINNRTGELMPGGLAEVHFKTPPATPTYIVPTAALIFRREGMQLGTVVNSSQGTVAHLLPIVVGQDDGATVQVISGLDKDAKVIQDPPDSLIEGEKVTVVNSGNSPQAGGK